MPSGYERAYTNLIRFASLTGLFTDQIGEKFVTSCGSCNSINVFVAFYIGLVPDTIISPIINKSAYDSKWLYPSINCDGSQLIK